MPEATNTTKDTSHLLVPDAIEKDYNPERLGKLAARLDTEDLGVFFNQLERVDGVGWWERAASIIKVSPEAKRMLQVLASNVNSD